MRPNYSAVSVMSLLCLLYLHATCSLFAAVLFGVVTNGEAIAAAANEAHGQRITHVRLSTIILFILVSNVAIFILLPGKLLGCTKARLGGRCSQTGGQIQRQQQCGRPVRTLTLPCRIALCDIFFFQPMLFLHPAWLYVLRLRCVAQPMLPE
jgi:hypothetical protein